MKKLKGLLLFILCLVLLTACAKNNSSTQTNENVTPEVTQTPDTNPTAAVTPTNAAENTSQDAAVTGTANEKIDINIAALKGPTAIGMLKVMGDAEAGTTANNYKFTIAGAADVISTGLVKGDIDIAAVPCNLASVLYNKTSGKVKLAGINTLGVLYIVETGNSIQSVEDLKGKTIYSTGLGTTPQYTLNYLLTAHGIDPKKDVTIEYKSEPTEVAAILSKSDNAVAMLPQPYITTVMMKNDKVRIALDVAKEWDKVSTDGSSVITGVLVVRSDFLDKNKEAFDAFMEEYAASTENANKDIEATAALSEKFDIFPAAVAKQAIPYCNITLIRGDDMKSKVNGYLTALFNQNPEAVGGKLPADDFYYMP